MPHVLMICTANICRSPVAEAVLRERLRALGRGDWTVSSAGTWAQWTRGASRHSVGLLAERGLDISDHRAQMVTEEHLAAADLVLTMASGHAEALRAEFPQHAHKVFMLSEMVGLNYDISDPYGGPRQEYVTMIDGVTKLIDNGLERIMELAAATSPE